MANRKNDQDSNKELQRKVDEGPVVSSSNVSGQAENEKIEDQLDEFSLGHTEEDLKERDRKIYGSVDNAEQRSKNI